VNYVRTVLGDIAASELGICYAHEHIVIDRSFVTQQNPEFLLSNVDAITTELCGFYNAGGRAMVDSMPCGGGRNVLKLAEISRRSKVHILCPTGVHLPIYYPEGHWTERADVEQISEIFVDEIETGIDRNDTNGPYRKPTPHRAGIIKVASGANPLDDRDRKIFAAAAFAHHATGVPILTHTEQGKGGMEQVRFLMDHGVSPKHIVLSHLDRAPDVSYHREVLSTGVYLEYDSAFRWQGKENPTLDLLLTLADEGLLNQLMLGMDAARNRYWKSFGGRPGLTFLLGAFCDMLRSNGWSHTEINQVFLHNPASAYALVDASGEEVAQNAGTLV